MTRECERGFGSEGAEAAAASCHLLFSFMQHETHLTIDVSGEGEQLAQVEIVISNIWSSFSLCCNIDLGDVARRAMDVEYEKGKLTLHLRRPYTVASVWSSGKVVCKVVCPSGGFPA